jgi:hypothetical protein
MLLQTINRVRALSIALMLAASGLITASAQTYSIEGNGTGFPVFGGNFDYNLGTKFYTTQAGHITGLRIYGTLGESGNHQCYLFNLTANVTTNLGVWSFTGENKWITKSIPRPSSLPDTIM